MSSLTGSPQNPGNFYSILSVPTNMIRKSSLISAEFQEFLDPAEWMNRPAPDIRGSAARYKKSFSLQMSISCAQESIAKKFAPFYNKIVEIDEEVEI